MAILQRMDAALAALLGPLARLVLWGAVCGVLSMLLYRWLSPQRRIEDLSRRSAEARSALSRYDGDLSGAWPLMASSLSVSLRHLALTLLPAVLASLPLILVLLWIGGAYSGVVCLPAGPAWLRGWQAPYFVSMVGASLLIKVLCRIH